MTMKTNQPKIKTSRRNLEALIEEMGWEKGSIFQVSAALKVPARYLLDIKTELAWNILKAKARELRNENLVKANKE